MSTYNIYYYWDSVDNRPFPAHLDLCLQTWHHNASRANIIKVSLDNIEEITAGQLTAKALSLFSPAQRSDAAMPVILASNAGIFLDVGTILTPAFNPARYMDAKTPTMYAIQQPNGPEPQLAFLSAPNAARENLFLSMWQAKTMAKVHHEATSFYRKLRRAIRKLKGKTSHVTWSYLGASILNPLASTPALKTEIIFENALTSGFLPKCTNTGYGPDVVNAYWLEPQTQNQFNAGDYPHGIIALQNSWLPPEIKSASMDEILNHPSRLGALLRFALQA